MDCQSSGDGSSMIDIPGLSVRTCGKAHEEPRVSVYELAILGNASNAERATLGAEIGRMVAEFGLTVGTEIILHDGTTIGRRDKHAAFAAAYFGGLPHADTAAAQEVARSSVPIIPTVSSTGDFGTEIPGFLQASNGLRRRRDDANLTELAVALLECVGLLRWQRRAFVSYRRIQSRAAAMQLHDLLAAKGFDVFLDTHDIRPGESFQDVLWHRLCDSDVMVMLDTPTYFESKWTRQELGRALAKEIHVLRVVWPDHVPGKLTTLSDTMYLDHSLLIGDDGPIVEPVAEKIVLAVESLRSRSIASRYMSITGRLRAEVEKIGASVEGIGAHRAIAIRLLNNTRIFAYPVVGIPTAELLNNVADTAARASQDGTPWLVYDNIGIGEQWTAHLKWLDDNITVVRALKVNEAGWVLAALEA